VRRSAPAASRPAAAAPTAPTTAEPAPSPYPGRPPWATRRLGWLLLALVAYVPPFLTAPGKVAADTKQYLYLDPGRLLARAPYLWDSHIGLGTVTHQTIGYLFPMGPFFRAFEAIGAPDWVAQRIWLGTIVLAAGAGVLYLLRTLSVTGPGVVVAALVYMLSPYSLNYAARISVLLLPWAALGFFIGLADKSLRDGGWRYPAAFALLVQLVGGVNATALVFAGIAPVLWIAWAAVAREVGARRALAVTAKIGVLTALTSLWWMAGLLMQSAYSLPIVEYTETVRAVARTSTPNEVLRGLGYWFFYGQDKLGPWIEASENYTQNPLRIAVGYSIPALAFLGLLFVRFRHRAFFLLLLLAGLLIAVGAYPYDDPSPLGALFKAFAEESSAGLALRSTGRAAPLVVLALAVAIGMGVNAVVASLHRRGHGWRALGPAALVAVLAVANFPALWDGTYYGSNLQRPEEIPDHWQAAIGHLDAAGDATRILEVPGADFASYRWGNTVDPITPGLTDRPYVARELVPWGSAAGQDLLNAFDRRLQEGVADPDGVVPIARLLGAGDVVARYDVQHERYDLVRPRFLRRVLDAARGLGAAVPFGGELDESRTPFPRMDERLLASPPGEPVTAPVEVHEVPAPRPVVRAEPAEGPLLLSGDGEGLVDAAEVGLLEQDRVILYSATFAGAPAELRSHAARDAILVVTDSNRRRGRRWSTIRDNTGYTEQAREKRFVEPDGETPLDVFPEAGDDPATQTVTDQGPAVVTVQASDYGNPISFTAEDRAARALDGDLDTAWKTSAFDDPIGERLRIVLPEPVTADRLGLVQPLRGPRDRFVTEVELRFDGGEAQRFGLGDASRTAEGQVLRFAPRTFSELVIEITDTNRGRGALLHGGESAVGFAEVRLRGAGGAPIRVDEVVVVPTDLLDAVGAASAGNALVYVFARERQIEVPPRTSPERTIVRRFEVPTDRTFALTGDARIHAAADSDTIDALLAPDGGAPGSGVRVVDARASETLAGCVHCRARAAIDGDPGTAWRTPLIGVVGQWVEYELSAPVRVDRLDLAVVADGRHSVPTRLRVTVGGAEQVVDVPPVDDRTGTENATVRVPVDLEPMRGRTVRVAVEEVREVRFVEFHSNRPVTQPVGIAELGIPGVAAPALPDAVDSGCRADLMALDGEPVTVRVTGDRVAAEHGEPLTISLCGGAAGEGGPDAPAGRGLTLTAGTHVVTTVLGAQSGLDVDRVVLASSPAGEPMAVGEGRVTGLPPAPPPGPEVTVVGEDPVSYDVRVAAADAPYWLVLGQSRSDGWEATASPVGGVGEPGDLGTPTLVDGFANGWLVEPRGHALAVELEWVPQRIVWAGIAASIAAAAACLGLLAAGRRRPPVATRAPDHPALAWEPAARGPLPARVAAGAAVAGGALWALAVRPWAGLLLAALVLLLWWRPAWRAALGAASAGLVGLVGLYVAAKQVRSEPPPVFEWPTLFPRAQAPTWVALTLLVAVVLVDELRRRRAGRGGGPPGGTAVTGDPGPGRRTPG
jgi:arabinofuranan 3-O-arabinosyltransferase